MLRKIKELFQALRWLMQPAYKTLFIEDLPQNIKTKAIYIVGTKQYPWQAALKCPCGCGALIQLNLLSESRPCWKFKVNTIKKITISPSIWREIGCKSHFFIHSGKIKWAKSL